MPDHSLAAVLFSDLAGFSAMASTNEAKALQLIELNRQHQKPIIQKYGTFVKEMGDGMMATFQSARDAIACAYEIQSSLPDLLKDKIRIGIHLGDIEKKQGDVFGDGVNIASRIESVAKPGTIYVSESVYAAVKSRDDIEMEFVGEKELKNITVPVKCYQVIKVHPAVLKADRKWQLNAKQLILPGIIVIALIVYFKFQKVSPEKRPTVIVLPFKQMGGDSSDQVLQKGLSNELITYLGKNNGLTVLNTITSTRYLGSLNPFEKASAELEQADYFVIGTYQKKDDQIELNVELKDRSNTAVWSNSYNRDIAYILEIIKSLATEISEALEQKLPESKQLNDIQHIDPETFELYLKGMNIIYDWNVGTMQTGIPYLLEAVDRRPADSRAWSGLAEGYVWLGHTPTGPPDAWLKAKSAAIKAIQLDSTNAEAWAALAHAKTYFEYDYEGAQICYQKANALNPNIAFNHYHYAWHLYLLDSMEKAIEEHRIAQKLDPFAPVHTFWLGGLLMFDGQLDEAKKELFKSLKMDPNSPQAWSLLGEVYLKEGNSDSVEFCFQKAISLNPFERYITLMRYYLEIGKTEEGMEILNEIKRMPENSFTSFLKSMAYEGLDSADQYFKWMNFEPRIAFIPWVCRKNTNSQVILDDPRYQELLDALNLPPPTRFDDGF